MKFTFFAGCSLSILLATLAPLSAQEVFLPHEVRDVLADPSGTIWFATDRGLFQFEADTLLRLTESDGLVSDSLTSLIRDKHGRLWIGTRDGISIYSQGRFSNLSYKDGLLDKTIHQLYLSTNKRVWAATDKGPHIFDGRRFQVVGVLKDTAVFYIEENEHNWIFLTENGVVRLEKQTRSKSVAWRIVVPLALGLTVIGAGGYWLHRFVLKSKLKLALTKSQQKALLAQMNPHFIFNSLNSVQKFILEENREAAHEYLAKFSSLMRMTLENSRRETILLRDEIKTIELYLALEAQRFQQGFDYSVDVSDDELLEIEIPTMLLQPFVENAVWHGLANKETRGSIKVAFAKSASNHLICEIQDNGIGREKAAAQQRQGAEIRKSRGMEIIQERIAALNRASRAKIECKIEDRMNNGAVAGTLVTLSIPVVLSW